MTNLKNEEIVEKIKNILSRNFQRIIIYQISLFLSFVLLVKNIHQHNFDKKSILEILISIVSIIVAIIVTFLFSKLFAEKTIRVERKKEIDELSLKITYLRRIAYHIRGINVFWQFKDVNIKDIIDHQYKTLTYKEFRGNDKSKKLTYDELETIHHNIFGTDGQAYLALKGLEDGAFSPSFYAEINPQNYTLDDISRYLNYVNSFNYLLNNSNEEIVNFNGIPPFLLSRINELYFKIMGKQINLKNYKNNIKDLFTEFESVILIKHYHHNSLNNNIFPITFKNSFGNMLIFVIILLISLAFYIVNINSSIEILITIILVSFFISNTIDLVILTFYSIKEELNIKDIFKV